MSLVALDPPLDMDTDYAPSGHRYNDDLLLDQGVRDRAKREHSEVFHILDWAALRTTFRPLNDAANDAKKRSHVAGFWAVTAALLALSAASTELLWSKLVEPLPTVIAGISGILGMFAFAIAGTGLIYGKHKDTWLW